MEKKMQPNPETQCEKERKNEEDQTRPSVKGKWKKEEEEDQCERKTHRTQWTKKKSSKVAVVAPTVVPSVCV